MAWMPTKFMLKAILDNHVPGRVTGWMRLAGIPIMVLIDLQGDFDLDIRGEKVAILGHGDAEDPEAAAAMAGFSLHQAGKVLHMTAGRNPQLGSIPRFAWASQANSHVILEPQPCQVRIVGELAAILSPAVCNKRVGEQMTRRRP